MKTPALAVVAHQHSTVRIACSGEVELRRVEPTASTGFVVLGKLFPRSPLGIALDAGLYHLAAAGNVSCVVITGQCTVMFVVDGEDPWPTPPPPQFVDEAAYVVAARTYFMT